MLYQLTITLTEEDYFTYNYFQTLESSCAKKQLKKTRLTTISITAVAIVIFFFLLDQSIISFICSLFLGLYTTIYMLLFKKIQKWNIKAQIKNLKKFGKLPFDTSSKIEFHEDLFVETSTFVRSEVIYSAIERICIVADKYLFLYSNSSSAYILPIKQVKGQVDYNAFINFLLQKCANVEYY